MRCGRYGEEVKHKVKRGVGQGEGWIGIRFGMRNMYKE